MIAGRWVLLLCTVFGLATMHTLGHSGMHGQAHGHDKTQAVAGYAAEQAVPCDDRHCPEPGGSTSWSVCLAVLSGLAVLVLLAAVVLRRLRGDAGRTVSAVARAPRAPPARRPQGLRVTSVAVLRI